MPSENEDQLLHFSGMSPTKLIDGFDIQELLGSVYKDRI